MSRRSAALVGVAVTTTVAAAILATDCDAPDSQQYVALLVLPAVTAGSLGLVGWLSQTGRTQQIAAALLSAVILGGLAWLLVIYLFAGCGT